MNTRKKIVIICAFVALLPVSLMAAFVYAIYHLDDDRIISGPVTITNQWLEITPDPPLTPKRSVQYIRLYVSDKYQAFTPKDQLWGLQAEDGRLIMPEVELLDGNSEVYKLSSQQIVTGHNPDTITTGDSIGYTVKGTLPQEVKYRKVRIRSNLPIRCEKIVWNGHTYK